METKIAIVTIHDVNPSCTERLEQVTDILEGQNISYNLSLVPFYQQKFNLINYSTFINQLLSLSKKQNVEITLHGLYHEINTVIEDFESQSKEQEKSEIQMGLKIIETVKLPLPTTFIPPAWRLSRETIEALKILNFKIIELRSKPQDWTGKTWASEKGLLSSRYNMLLFLDADCYYAKNCILFAISHMLSNKLDVITGYPFFVLKDFWSKISMPLWKLMSFTFQDDASHVNDPNSEVAYLMGCFFMIKKQVLIEIGSFAAVKNAIQEDKELGQKLKYSGYKLNMVQMDSFILALWSRNLSTLWHGLARTISPMMLYQKKKVFINFVTIFILAVLPSLLVVTNFPSIMQAQLLKDLTFNNYLHLITFVVYLFTFGLTTCCVIMKLVSMCGIFTSYALLFPLGGLFLTLVYLATMLPLILPIKRSSKKIEWKGRTYTYNRIVKK